MVKKARRRQPRAIREKDLGKAVSGLELSPSHFDRRRCSGRSPSSLPEGAGLFSLTAAVEWMVGSERVVLLHRASGPLDGDVFTTPRIAECAWHFIDGMLAGADAGAGVVDRATVDAVLARHDYPGADQRETVLPLTTGGERAIAVAAWPGTGKTTALAVAAEAWKEAGIPVKGCATARSATGELIDPDITDSTSITELTYLAKV